MNENSVQDDSHLIESAKKKAIFSIVISLIAVVTYLVLGMFFPMMLRGNSGLLLVIFLIVGIASIMLMYDALKIIENLSSSSSVAKNYYKSISVAIGSLVVVLLAAALSGVRTVLLLVALVGFIYAFYLHIKVFLEMAQITEVAFFKYYIGLLILGVVFGIIFKMSGNYMFDKLNSLSQIVAMVVQILAWTKIEKVYAK